MDILLIISGFFIGALVGLTGVGGGSLMTPLLVMIFKVNPLIAIGTDLLYASITKTAGVVAHNRLGNIDWKIVFKLLVASIPSCFFANIYLQGLNTNSPEVISLIEVFLGLALIITGLALLAQPVILKKIKFKFSEFNQTVLTLVLGIFLGITVTLTSVGAGAIGVTALLFIYPNMDIRKIVGTDIAHAVPITFFAGLGHYSLGHVDLLLLLSLLIGSIPGVWLGSLTSKKMKKERLRFILFFIVTIIGFKFLLNI